MSTTDPYADLEIRILERQEAGYPVEITLDGGQEFPRGFLTPDILSWTSTGDLQADGQYLFAALFGNEEARRAWERACGQHSQRRVRLRLDTTAPELHALPWERLHDGRTFVAAQGDTPFSRYLPLDMPYSAPVAERPIRVLAAIANPTGLDEYDLAPLDVDDERARLQAALQGQPVTLTFLDAPVTPVRLEAALRAQRPHILHLMAHGTFSTRRDQAALYLQDDAGNCQIVTDDELGNSLHNLGEDRPRLVFLAACEGAARSAVDAFAGLAPKLVRAGVPAVVAMQDKVALTTTRQLTPEFYADLFRHGEVDRALNAARSLLLAAQAADAATPVLLMRLKDGRLFTPEGDAAPYAPFMADALPPDFVPRPTEFNALRDALLATDRDVSVAPTILVGITAALRGAGGYGKTILARALCHELRDEFPDGVLWVTLGETPNVTHGIFKIHSALTGERVNFVDEEDAAQNLVKALGDKHCLLVIDDVWNAAHLRPFLRGGPHCARLITTRNRDTLPADVHPVDVDAMRADEAVTLVGAGLGAPSWSPLRTLAARLGEWPLLLGLANGALRARIDRGQSLDDALAWVNRALDKRGLTAFDARDAEARNQAVTLTLGVSLDLLTADERARYTELAVFPEDVDIPLAALEVLWAATDDLDDFDVEDLCQRLADLSLVQSFDLNLRVVRLHDVVRAYLEHQHVHLPALHAQLVEAYAAQCDTDSSGAVTWGTGPDDGYYYQHLPYHFAQARRAADLCTLLLDFDWLHAKLHATNINALIADYDLPLSLPPDGGKVREGRLLNLIQGALRLSAHVLAQDKTQLQGQLIGRLGRLGADEIQILLHSAHELCTVPYLCPLSASLIPPGGPLLRTLAGHTDDIIAVAVTPDGQRVVSASGDHTLKVWDLESGAELHTLTGHTDDVRAVAVTPDGQWAVSASRDKTLKVWDLESGAELH
ncbi:MAG: CHAT domain-containing protein, partial [Anaerolineae bacterium]|nr:CHAT domain-containing protein [Anaerolineae bacterium]